VELSQQFNAYLRVSGGDRAVRKIWAPAIAALSLFVTSTNVFARPINTDSSGSALLVAHAVAAKHTTPTTSAGNSQKASEGSGDTPPFTNNHYVLTGSFPTNGFRKGDPTVFIVDKGSHSTYVLQKQDDRIVRVLTVSNAVGNLDKPTPPGRYTIVNKKMYPTWIPPKTIKHAIVKPYNITHENPLGVAAIYLNKFDIDLHGTNQPDAIRKSISHGCVRHSNPDILKLYNMASIGDVVYIVNKFRGKVLNKADFVSHKSMAKTKHVAAGESTTPTPVSKVKDTPQKKNVSISWYTVDA
jgi:lipoprotein-anchoring transpeptidase ErfK/SrfK